MINMNKTRVYRRTSKTSKKYDDFAYRDLLRQVLDSDHRRNKRMSGRHIPISTWLDALNIPQYVHLFHQYQGVEDLLSATESDIKEVGIRHGGHRAKIVSSLRILRDKYDKGKPQRSQGLIYQGVPNYNAPEPPVSPLRISDPQQLAATKEKLRLDLEKELSGDPSELRTQAWYHGNISREHAETVIKENGDYLVRDCISQPGDFVVTCRWKGTVLNFMINSIVGNCAPGQLPPLSYKFEDESFPTIQQLISCYQNSGKSVTLASGAVLKTPKSRCMPLSYYDTKYGALFNFISTVCGTPSQSPKSSPFITPDNSPAMKRKGVVWTGSHPALSNPSSTNGGGGGDDGGGAGRASRDRRCPSLERCDSLPVIKLIPPEGGGRGGGKTGSQDNLNGPPKSAEVTTTPTLAYAKLPTTSFHQRSGSAPAPVVIDPSAHAPSSMNQTTTTTTTTTKHSSSHPDTINNNADKNNNNNNNNNSIHHHNNSNNNKTPSPSSSTPPLPRRTTTLQRRTGSKLSSNSSLSSNRKPLPATPTTQPPSHHDGSSSSSGSGSGSGSATAPPPKPSRVPSLKYRLKPTVVIRNIQVDDDDRDYSDYGQIKEGPSWLLTEKTSKPFGKIAEENMKSPLGGSGSSSSGSGSGNTSHHHHHQQHQQHQQQEELQQKGRKAGGRLNKSGLSIDTHTASPGNKSGSNHGNSNNSNNNNNVTNSTSRVPPQFATGLVPEEIQTPPSPSYRIVARSRSFQVGGAGGQNKENKDDNNDDDGDDDDDDDDYVYDKTPTNPKGYATLPNRSKMKKKKTRDRSGSDTHFAAIDKTNTDYDYPADDSEKSDFPDAYTLNIRRITHPPKSYKSAINPDTFRSPLLPPDHKVLDANVLKNVKAILLSKDPKSIGLHITRHDLYIMKGVSAKDLGMGITSGFELLTLPQGTQVRQDVIERWECLRLFVILTLMSSQTVTERAKMISLWIQTCFELKYKQGNLFSFSAVMAGMCSPQILRLKDTWLILRQNHTARAYLFDTKLKSAFASLKDGSSDLPLNNVSVPYVLPVAQLLESLNVEAMKMTANQLTWEEGLDAVGVAIDVLLAHLDTARVVASQYGMYRVFGNGLMAAVLANDEDLDTLLNPAFHLLLMWGDKGCGAKRQHRLAKLDQIFTLLSQKYQVPGDDGTEV